MKIEFDSKKEKINPLNHNGVTFDEAKPVLLDPYAITLEDKDNNYSWNGKKEPSFNRHLDTSRRNYSDYIRLES